MVQHSNLTCNAVSFIFSQFIPRDEYIVQGSIRTLPKQKTLSLSSIAAADINYFY